MKRQIVTTMYNNSNNCTLISLATICNKTWLLLILTYCLCYVYSSESDSGIIVGDGEATCYSVVTFFNQLLLLSRYECYREDLNDHPT